MQHACTFIFLAAPILLVAGIPAPITDRYLPVVDEYEPINAYPEEMSGFFEGDIILSSRHKVVGRNLVIDPHALWANKTLVYEFSDEYSRDEKRWIKFAVDVLQNETCIRFIERTTEQDYMYIRNKMGCASPVGFHPGRMDMYLQLPDCLRFGTIQHEFLHVLGFWHEHTRPDRDNYVTIEWENIISGMEDNFKLHDFKESQVESMPYDYGSVMHYRSVAFSKDVTSPTIVPRRNSSDSALMGQRKGLSKVDVAKLNRLYDCGPEYYNGWDLLTSTPASATQVTETTPDVTEYTPSATGSTPGSTGATSGTTGSTSEATGSTPGATGSTSGATGSTSEVTGATPGATGSTPTNEGSTKQHTTLAPSHTFTASIPTETNTGGEELKTKATEAAFETSTGHTITDVTVTGRTVTDVTVTESSRTTDLTETVPTDHATTRHETTNGVMSATTVPYHVITERMTTIHPKPEEETSNENSGASSEESSESVEKSSELYRGKPMIVMTGNELDSPTNMDKFFARIFRRVVRDVYHPRNPNYDPAGVFYDLSPPDQDAPNYWSRPDLELEHRSLGCRERPSSSNKPNINNNKPDNNNRTNSKRPISNSQAPNNKNSTKDDLDFESAAKDNNDGTEDREIYDDYTNSDSLSRPNHATQYGTPLTPLGAPTNPGARKDHSFTLKKLQDRDE